MAARVLMKNSLPTNFLASLCFVFSALTFSFAIVAVTALLGIYDYQAHLTIMVFAPFAALLFTVQSLKGQNWQKKIMVGVLPFSLLHLFELSVNTLSIAIFNLLTGIIALYLSAHISKRLTTKNIK